jgi:hypothetical protein
LKSRQTARADKPAQSGWIIQKVDTISQVITSNVLLGEHQWRRCGVTSSGNEERLNLAEDSVAIALALEKDD